jgi:hypothetical protein
MSIAHVKGVLDTSVKIRGQLEMISPPLEILIFLFMTGQNVTIKLIKRI